MLGFGGNACFIFDDDDDDAPPDGPPIAVDEGEKGCASARNLYFFGDEGPSLGSGRIWRPVAAEFEDGSGDDRGEDDAEDDISGGREGW